MSNKFKFFLSVTLSTLFVLSLLSGCGKDTSPSAGSVGQPGSRSDAEKKLSVMASFYPMYDFTQKIGGDKVNVTNMVPSGMEPHDWEPAASDIVALEQADVFVYSGAGMEHWAEDVLNSLEHKDLVTIEASEGIQLREGHHHHGEEDADEHHADEHYDEAGYDPHVWIAPMNAKQQMENIKNALVKADPANMGYYESNYIMWGTECDKLDQEYKDALSDVSGKNIVVSHEAFGYLCDAYGLHQLGIQGIEPDSEPDPGRMAEIQDFVTEHSVKVIFSEELVSPKVAQAIADATGAKVNVLSPLEGLSDEQQAAGNDYFAVMRQNLDALKEALQ